MANLRRLMGSFALVCLFLFPLTTYGEHAGGFASSDRQSSTGTSRCAQRVKEAGCYLSNNNVERIADNVRSCKQVNSSSGKTQLELFQLKNGKVVVVKTKGPGVTKRKEDSLNNCPVIRYQFDSSGIKVIKILGKNGNKTWMLSNDGALYIMLPDGQTQEVLNSSGKSYSGIKDIKGVDGDRDSIKLVFSGQDYILNQDTFDKRKKRALQFTTTYTDRSLFRDE